MSEVLDFYVKDEVLGDTHQLKVHFKTACLMLDTTKGYNVYKNLIKADGRESVDVSEIKKLFRGLAELATKEVYGGLPMDLYHICANKSDMDANEKERAQAWFKIVNDGLERTGYRFRLS